VIDEHVDDAVKHQARSLVSQSQCVFDRPHGQDVMVGAGKMQRGIRGAHTRDDTGVAFPDGQEALGKMMVIHQTRDDHAADVAGAQYPVELFPSRAGSCNQNSSKL